MRRRAVLAGLAAAQMAGLAPARAQAPWPARAVTLVVPFPPGGQSDLAARPVAAALQRILSQPVNIEYRSGGGGSVGNAAVARAEPDGYTLLVSVPSLAVLPEADKLFGRRPAYDVSQLVPVARILADPCVLAVPASAPWKTLGELVADARARPGEIPYGSSGAYGVLHVATEMFAHAADIKLLHVPLRGGGPALSSLLGGETQVLVSAPGVVKPHAESGAVRVLANFGAARIATCPDVPTLRELGYAEVEVYIWVGMFAPRALPTAIATRLAEVVRVALDNPQVRRTLEAGGSLPAYQDGPAFQRFFEADSARLIRAVAKIGKVE